MTLHRSSCSYALRLSLLLMLTACQNPTASVPSNPNPSDQSASLSQDLRPGTKGQRLELVEGEMLIPAGTNYFVIQSTPLAFGTQSQLMNWLTPPAQADSTDEADNPIELSQIEKLVVRVNGENVDFEVLDISESESGDLLVRYRLKNVPITEDNALIEFESPSGAFKMKALHPPIAPGLQRLSERLDLESTAVVEAVKHAGLPLKGYSPNELQRLKQAGFVQQIRNVVYAHFVAPPTPQRPPRFDDNRQKYPQPQADAAFQRYAQERLACQRSPRACQRPPEPPQAMQRAVPQALQERIQHREQIRRQGFRPRLPRPDTLSEPSPQPQPQTDTTGTVSADDLSAEQLQRLLEMGPLMRREYCLRHQINPCPGLLL